MATRKRRQSELAGAPCYNGSLRRAMGKETMYLLDKLAAFLAFLCRICGVTPDTVRKSDSSDEKARQEAAGEDRALAKAKTEARMQGLRRD